MDPISMLESLFPTQREIISRGSGNWLSAPVRHAVDFGPSVIMNAAMRDPAYLQSIDAAGYLQAQYGISAGSGGSGGSALTKMTSMRGRIDGDDSSHAVARFGQDVTVGDASVIESEGGGVLSAGDDSTVRGGDYENRIFMGDRSVAVGGSQDDYISGGENSVGRGGDGDDRLMLGDGSIASGGSGNDTLWVGDASLVEGGSGDDTIDAGAGSVVNAGSGNDTVELRTSSVFLDEYGTATIVGGRGNDDFIVKDGLSTDFVFNKGDGADTIAAGDGNLDGVNDGLDNALLRMDDYKSSEATLAVDGDDLVLQLGSNGDSVRIKDYANAGNDMTFVFRDATFTLSDLAATVGV